jgi:hypothetical protein
MTFNPIHRVGVAVFILALCGALISLAYGWSLNETQRMMSAVVGLQYALAASLVIQIGPQPRLVLSSMTRRDKYQDKLEFITSLSGLVLIMALVLNLVDMTTNIFAFNDWFNRYQDPTLLPETRMMAQIMGFFLSAFVTWSEEISLILFASALELVRQARADMGLSSPKWFTWDVAGLARQAATGQPSNPRQEQRSPQQEQQRREIDPRQHEQRRN